MPAKTMMSDETLRTAIVRELEWDPKVDATYVGVSAKDGAATLTGHVDSYPQKIAAVRAAERVYGVRAVADEIEVELPSSGRRNDSEIAEEIARERSWNTLIPATIEAEVRDGWVQLRGEVEWPYQRDEAIRAVQHLWGVKGVDSSIVVKPHVKAKPEEVEQRVHDAIARMADLDARSIWVTSTDGTVHLHGHVHSLSERRIAENAAASAPGVVTVEDDIVVTP